MYEPMTKASRRGKCVCQYQFLYLFTVVSSFVLSPDIDREGEEGGGGGRGGDINILFSIDSHPPQCRPVAQRQRRQRGRHD